MFAVAPWKHNTNYGCWNNGNTNRYTLRTESENTQGEKMLNKENKDLCWAVLTKYGIRNQQHMVIEECSELQKAICKLYRAKTQEEYKEFYRNFIEELLDVIAVCQQMLLSENVSMSEVNDFIKAKLIIALERADRNGKS